MNPRPGLHKSWPLSYYTLLLMTSCVLLLTMLTWAKVNQLHSGSKSSTGWDKLTLLQLSALQNSLSGTEIRNVSYQNPDARFERITTPGCKKV